MRVVAISDTHSRGANLGKLPDGDVLVHCGDHTIHGGYLECEEALRWLGRQPHKVKLLIPGNHDLLAQRDSQAWAHLCHTYNLNDLNAVSTVSYNGLYTAGFAASPSSRPRQVSPHFGAFQYLRAFGFDWGSVLPEGLDLLVTHGPPEGILDYVDESSGRVGCRGLRDALSYLTLEEAAPKLHLFGHIHESAGMEKWGDTLFCNVSTDHGKLPATVLDFNDGQWTWVSGPGGD